MDEIIIPAGDNLAAHEQAAAEITEMRKKGIHCHLEEESNRHGHQVTVVRDGDEPAGNPQPPERVMHGSRASTGGIES